MNRHTRISATLFSGLLAMSSLAVAGNGALLGVTTLYPDITYVSGTLAQGAVYTAGSTHNLVITATPTTVTFTPTGSPETVVGGVLTVTANIKTTGIFDPSGSTFKLTGTVIDTKGTPSAGDDVTYTGTLLSGPVTDYGILDIGTTDLADFKLKATGGSLLAKMGGNNAVVGMTTTLEDSTFAGLFTSNWSAATVKGNVGPVPTKQPFPCYNVGNIAVKNKSGATSDEVKITKSGVQLPVGVNFNPAADDVTVAIDGLVTIIPAGSFVQQGSQQDFKYSTASGVTPKVTMRLNFAKGTWEFNYTKGDVSLITTANGVDVTLTVGIYTGTEHVVVVTNNGSSSDSHASHPPSCKPGGGGSDSGTPGINKMSCISSIIVSDPTGNIITKLRSLAEIGHPETTFTDQTTGEVGIIHTSCSQCLTCGQVWPGGLGGAFTILELGGAPGDKMALKCGVADASCDIQP